MPDQRELWAVVAPFLVEATDRWVSDHIDDPQRRFETVVQRAPELSWHEKRLARTSAREWLRFHDASHRALSLVDRHEAAGGSGGLVTVFPQLAAAVGIQKRVRRRSTPLVAWFFNTADTSSLSTSAARTALSAVDRFVVHSTVEIEAYAAALGLAPDRFRFAPLQYGGSISTVEEDLESPFVFATGSGFRDYRTLFAAVEKLDLPTKIVAGDRILSGLDIPPTVEIMNDASRPEIHDMMRRARVNVVPLTDRGLTAGIVTIAETYRHRRGLVVTRRPGLEDYVVPGRTAVEAAHGDPVAMADAIEGLWTDAGLRARLDHGAAAFGEDHCSDEAAGRNLVAVLDELST